MLCRFQQLKATVLGCMLGLTGINASADTVVPLVEYTNSWRFHDTGTDPGAAWMTAGFDDTSWPEGQGPFGFEPVWPFPYPLRIATPLTLGVPSTPAFFFRTHFQFNPTNFGVGQQLVADLFVDDGCVIFLKGVELARLRVPVGETYLTFANGFQANEGTNEVVTMSSAPLLPGDNVLAVAVHQNTSFSSDLYFGMRLRAVTPDPVVAPSITQQPQDTAVENGKNGTLTVKAVGQPLSYQWRKNGVAISGETKASYVVYYAQAASAGVYSVVVSNQLGVVTSTDATVTVVPDVSGPRLLWAVVSPPLTNRILVRFSERLSLTVRTNRALFALTPVGSTNLVTHTNFFYASDASPPFESTMVLTVGGPLWQYGSNYILTVNGVRDISPAQNIIAPNSQAALTYPSSNLVIEAGQVWRYHASLLDDPAIADAPWFATNYVENAWWQTGVGAFYASDDGSACTPNLMTAVPFQRHPTLFRTTFDWPAGRGASATLNFQYQVNDGVVFYLNGREVMRTNLPALPAPLDVNTRALSTFTRCTTNSVTVTNLLPGSNWLAAAVYQSVQPYSGPIETNFLFYLTVNQSIQVGATLPELPDPQLNITTLPGRKARLEWTGPGFALESTTGFTAGPEAVPGPWLEVPNMSNPYTNNSTTEGLRIYRLRK